MHFHFQNMRTIAASIAIRTADEHVAEKLHFDFLETRTAAAFALSLRRIETERARIQSALFRNFRLRKDFANVIERANIDGGIRPRRFAERRLVHEHRAVDVFETFETCCVLRVACFRTAALVSLVLVSIHALRGFRGHF